MTASANRVKQVELLTTSQIAQFKRDDFLVLPSVLDPELCRQMRDQLWETIEANLPRMKRGDPSTWTPVSEQESSRPSVPPPAGGEDPYFGGIDYRLYVRNGTEQLMLDLAPPSLVAGSRAASGHGNAGVARRE